MTVKTYVSPTRLLSSVGHILKSVLISWNQKRPSGVLAGGRAGAHTHTHAFVQLSLWGHSYCRCDASSGDLNVSPQVSVAESVLTFSNDLPTAV